MKDVKQKANGEINSPAQAEFDPIRWAQLNPWLSEGQEDDRTPMNGAVKDSGGGPSAQRAFARRSHQQMFKKWSQARREHVPALRRKCLDGQFPEHEEN
jgi:hypothetical protein